MAIGGIHLEKLLHKQPFLFLLISQGVSNIGDSFRFIALTMLLLKLTGSGMSTSLGLIFSILPSMILSPIAGTVGDIIRAKPFMAIIDLVRAAVIFLLTICRIADEVFAIILILSLLDTIYSPARRKIIASLAGKNGIITANSLLTGISGIAFLIGPLIAGSLIEINGVDFIFIIASVASLISSILIMLIKTNDKKRVKRSDAKLFQEMINGFNYIKNNSTLIMLTLIYSFVAVCSVSMNIAFYPFSFDIMSLGAKEWSLMISIYYGTNLFAAFLILLPLNRISLKPWSAIYLCLCSTSFIWFTYSITGNYLIVLALQFIEGTIIAISSILLASLLQKNTKSTFMARVAGVNDIIASTGKMVGMVVTYLLLTYNQYKPVFIMNSLILFIFVIVCMLKTRHSRLN